MTTGENEERLLSVEQARAVDRDAAERLRMPTIVLMENAARSVAEIARPLGDRFVILCGAGNNGGDGLAIARHLGRAITQVHLLAKPSPERAPDAATQLGILRAAGWPIAVGGGPAVTDGGERVVWIDALFGTGLVRDLTGAAREWVECYNAAAGTKVAVDIPSGLHGDTGEVLGIACCADVTVTFVARKHGMATASGAAHCGRVHIVGLGLPD